MFCKAALVGSHRILIRTVAVHKQGVRAVRLKRAAGDVAYVVLSSAQAGEVQYKG